MNRTGQLLCAWSGILSIVVFFIGFWPMAHFMPPLSPAWGSQQVADFYLGNPIGMRVGAICILFSAGLLVLFYSGITVQIKRIEGQFGPMSVAQIALGVLAVVPFIPGAVAMCVAVYRPERDPADIVLISDYIWILFFLVAAPLMFQLLTIGYAILTDRNSTPVFPRWLGYLSFWSAILSIPGNVIVFFLRRPVCLERTFWILDPRFSIWTLDASDGLAVDKSNKQ